MEKIKDMAGLEGGIIWDATKPDSRPRRCLNTSRAKEFFGFEAQMPFDEGLRETIGWWRSRQNKHKLQYAAVADDAV